MIENESVSFLSDLNIRFEHGVSTGRYSNVRCKARFEKLIVHSLSQFTLINVSELIKKNLSILEFGTIEVLIQHKM